MFGKIRYIYMYKFYGRDTVIVQTFKLYRNIQIQPLAVSSLFHLISVLSARQEIPFRF